MNIRSWIPLATAGLALIVLAGGMTKQDRRLYLPIGSEAPVIEGVGVADGQAYSLKEMTARGPVFVIFWKDPCPHNPRAMPFINALTEAYGGKVQVLSVVRSSAEGARAWHEQFKPQHPLIADPGGALIEAYDMVYSIVPLQIGTDGKITAVFDGYGQTELTRLNQAMAQSAGVPVAEVDLARAPGRHPTYG